MTGADTSYSQTHQIAARRSEDPQERNRIWWETLPMTYETWESSDRLPQGRADFERINDSYFKGNPWITAHVDFSAFRDRDVLEIGCGAGSAACRFALGGARITAIDLTERAIDMTRANAANLGLKNIRVLRMDAEALELANNTVDFVYSWGVMHHSSRPERIFGEVSRVLRPGGGCLIMVYNRGSLRYWLKGLYWLFVKRKLLAGESMTSVQRFFTDGFFHKHFTARELRNELARGGLVTKRVSRTHMAKKMIPKIPRSLDEWMKRRWGWLLVIEAVKPPSRS